MRRFALAALVAAVPFVASAKKPPSHSPVTQVPPQLAEADLYGAGLRLARSSGTPRLLSGLDQAVTAASPETMARQFLAQNLSRLGLRDTLLSDLQFKSSRRSKAGNNVRFDQSYLGVPVYNGRVVVHINPANVVTLVSSGYQSLLSLPSVLPLVSAETARASAVRQLSAKAPFGLDRTTLTVYRGPDRTRLAWQVRLDAAQPIGDWEALVDAITGETFVLWDRAAYARGSIFEPDPLSSTRGAYGSPINDRDDADYPEINAQIQIADLGTISFEGGMYQLKNEWAELIDHETPNEGLFKQASPDFLFTREQQGFEASQTFHHIQKSMRYINETLGIPLMPYQYTGGVQFDPQGLDGDDNSHYSSGTGQLAFGEGCVDDNEDADVVLHELGHGLHDWVTDGGLSNMIDGLSEGFGDYWAQSYSRSLKQWTPADEAYQWVYSWDGHNECWDGRVTNYALPWPIGVTPYPLIHNGGQIFSTCMMKVYDILGREKTDTLVLEGLAMTNAISSQNDAAGAIYQAALDLGYSSQETATVGDTLGSCGYIVPAALLGGGSSGGSSGSSSSGGSSSGGSSSGGSSGSSSGGSTSGSGSSGSGSSSGGSTSGGSTSGGSSGSSGSGSSGSSSGGSSGSSSSGSSSGSSSSGSGSSSSGSSTGSGSSGSSTGSGSGSGSGGSGSGGSSGAGESGGNGGGSLSPTLLILLAGLGLRRRKLRAR